MTSAPGQSHQREGIDRRRLAVSLVLTPACMAALLFVPAGTWRWAQGWTFLGVMMASSAVSVAYLWRVNPEVVVARTNAHRGTKRWDRILMGVFFFVPVLAILPVAALDDVRLEWFPLPWWACLLGYVPFLVGMALLTWAQAVNKFFEPTVRLQTDRGQKVIDAGPYRFVRHPGYLSWLPLSVGMALSLGSLWALVPIAVSSLVLLVRTRWEDQTLQEELPGYKEYAQRVRDRLIPGVW
jgi:protein-S-isoprenylcysteine O-methyltransferase Ste14